MNGLISSQSNISANTTKRLSEKADDDNRHKKKQRRTRSGRKVADYREPISNSSDEEYSKYSLDDQNKNQKETTTSTLKLV